jgi:hypothetical protein
VWIAQRPQGGFCLSNSSKGSLVRLTICYAHVVCMLQHGNAARSFAIESGVASGLFGLLRSAGSATFIIVSMSFNRHLENKKAFSLVVRPDLSVIASNTTPFESCTDHIDIGSFISADKRLVVSNTHHRPTKNRPTQFLL